MKKHEIRYLHTAETDLTEIIDFVTRDSPRAALEMLDKIDARIRVLADFPEIGSIPKDFRLQQLGYRIQVVEAYLVFYVVKPEAVEIRRILHGMRKYQFLF